MAVFLCLHDLRVIWIGASPLYDFGGKHGLIGRAPALHQAQGAHSDFGDHPVMHTSIGFFRARAHPVVDGAFIVLGAVVCA
ncbi:hypothetical protein D3C84_1116940 [compost metagenome]